MIGLSPEQEKSFLRDWFAALPLPVRKASGFASSPDPFGGYAARGEASPFEVTLRKAGDFPHERRQSRNSMARRS